MIALQDQLAPKSICFGCGPANPQGLQIKSFPKDDQTLIGEFTPLPHHKAFRDVINGGILGALLDCHSNWCAAYALMKKHQLKTLPCTVTADFHVSLKRPTPFGVPLKLFAHAKEISENKVLVHATIEAHGKITATCEGNFVAIKEGHPAFHRWDGE